ncbi:hypothetical protein [Providencia stuartii]|uniref:hypothetical protein n=1 Tax=Providencia stuartii TaxID=588 RepID=UPI00111DD7E4|nr:hypothetical protein [Providencia stuartii]
MHDVFSIIQESLTIKIILGMAWTALSFFCGAYVGHRFNLSRDKRKEFNNVTDPLRMGLKRQLHKFRSNQYSGVPITETDISIISDMLNPYKSRKLIRTYELYREKTSIEAVNYEIDPVTEIWSIGDTTQAAKATEKLLTLLKRK